MAEEDDPASCVITVVGTQLETMRRQAKVRAARVLEESADVLFAKLVAPMTVVKTQKWVSHLGQPSVPLRWEGIFHVQVDSELSAQEDDGSEAPDNVRPFRRDH